MTKPRFISTIIFLSLVLATGLFLGGCNVIGSANIKNADQAKAYILDGLRDKYGEEFVIDGDLRINYTGSEKNRSPSIYTADKVYPVSDPSIVFTANCLPWGGLADTRAEYFFLPDAESLISQAFLDAGIDYLSSWQTTVEMGATVKTWHEGDSFDKFMGNGASSDPYIQVKLYLTPGLSAEECAKQVFPSLQALYSMGRQFEIRVFFEGDKNAWDVFFLHNTQVNHYTFDTEASVLDSIQKGMWDREFMQNQHAEE
jgi:hypothetical protein